LRGFKKIFLKPNEKKTVTFTLKPRDLSFINFDLERIVEPGLFEVMAGSSCDDIRLKGSFKVIQ